MRRRSKQKYERYEIDRSPFSQKPTQKDLATLLGMTRDELRRTLNYKDTCIVKRSEEINGKVRDLAYPVGPLRVIHEKLKYHLNKIKQPEYLFSPRKGRGQRDNAALHIDRQQYLSLDLKQFYPSTTLAMVKNWLIKSLGMYEDVAGLLAKLATVDGVVSFGSPLTPVLVSLVHREMFNEIAHECTKRDLNYSVWVDDLTISGDFIEGELLKKIRKTITKHGHKSHKITYRTGNKPVFITGIGVVGAHLVAPQTLHLRIKKLWEDLHDSKTLGERESVSQQLLAQLGTLKHIVGPKSEQGRKAADQMNSLRQKRDKWRKEEVKDTNITKLANMEETRTDDILESHSVPW
ncbi:reverse transcriptase family protein [Kordiimonas sp. SCSIO 12610]|uniref:reverse transcriptase family protein n=1 Tax=Kordiimonas sp. SCSIO 12610 TaxID=2829597 RepID=UPI00210E7744|nr:reverse transcriptase family protein [Kordiimonas sp. SCSIO 12610]UTW54825.1 RNA-directed DNA polymerase [Kordiimonas sp. SCSIO 12610]